MTVCVAHNKETACEVLFKICIIPIYTSDDCMLHILYEMRGVVFEMVKWRIDAFDRPDIE